MLTAALFVEEKRCKLINTNYKQLRFPFGKVSVDLIVDLPVSHHGNKNILVMVDQLTSWSIARAIPDKEAVTVANAVYKDLILHHGAPEILLSDNGKEFCNDTFAYVCE